MKFLIVFAVVAFVACCNGFGIPQETPTQEESTEKPANNEAMDAPPTVNNEDNDDGDSEKQLVAECSIPINTESADTTSTADSASSSEEDDSDSISLCNPDFTTPDDPVPTEAVSSVNYTPDSGAASVTTETLTGNEKTEGKNDDQAEKKPEQPVSTHHAMSVSSFTSTLVDNGKVLQDKHGKQTMVDDNGKITITKEGDAQ